MNQNARTPVATWPFVALILAAQFGGCMDASRDGDGGADSASPRIIAEGLEDMDTGSLMASATLLAWAAWNTSESPESHFVIMDRASGQELWRHSYPGEAIFTLTIDDHRVRWATAPLPGNETTVLTFFGWEGGTVDRLPIPPVFNEVWTMDGLTAYGFRLDEGLFRPYVYDAEAEKGEWLDMPAVVHDDENGEPQGLLTATFHGDYFLYTLIQDGWFDLVKWDLESGTHSILVTMPWMPRGQFESEAGIVLNTNEGLFIYDGTLSQVPGLDGPAWVAFAMGPDIAFTPHGPPFQGIEVYNTTTGMTSRLLAEQDVGMYSVDEQALVAAVRGEDDAWALWELQIPR